MSDAEPSLRKKRVRDGHRSKLKRLLDSKKDTFNKTNDTNANLFVAELT